VSIIICCRCRYRLCLILPLKAKRVSSFIWIFGQDHTQGQAFLSISPSHPLGPFLIHMVVEAKTLQVCPCKVVSWFASKNAAPAADFRREISTGRKNKKLSCRRDRTTLRVTQDHSRSFEMTLLSMACVSPY